MNKVPTFLYYLSSNSFYFKIGFIVKLSFFIFISIVSLIIDNLETYIFFIVLLLILISLTGFFKYNRRPLIFLVIALFFYSILWILLSNVEGDIIYYSFPWGTILTDQTLISMYYSIAKWTLIMLSGLFFMITSSETELIRTLIRLGLPKKAIYSIAIAFTTIGFALSDVGNVEEALNSRGYKSKGVIGKIKKIYYLGTTMLLSQIKRIEVLSFSYALREGEGK